jgi:hypothetical protein
MSNDYQRYGLSWGDDGWVNNQGVSFKMVSELVEKDDIENFQHQYPVDLIEYPELRTAGFSHADLADKSQNYKIRLDLENQTYPINDLISERLIKILKVND